MRKSPPDTSPQQKPLPEGREKLFGILIQSSSDGIALIDGKGITVYSSPMAAAISGAEPEEMEGKSAFATVHPDDRSKVQESFAEILQTPNGSNTVTVRILHRDGKYRWVETMNKNLLHDKEIRAIVCNFRDVTERMRAESERGAMLEIMQGVNDIADLRDLYPLIHSSLSKVLYAKNCFIALYNKDDGMFHEAFLVDQYDTISPPQKMTRSLTAYIFRTGKAALITEERFQRLVEAGEVELVGTNSPSWIGAPLKTRSETIGVMALQHYEKPDVYTERDVEFLEYACSQIAVAIERKQAEESVNASISLLTATLESTNDGILVVNREGRIAGHNSKFLSMWHIPPEVIDTRNDEDALAYVKSQLKYPDQFLARVSALYASTETDTDLVEFKDGRIFERYSQPQMVDGIVAGRVWSFRDITNQRRAQQVQDAVYHISEAAGNLPTLEALYPAVHRIIQSIMPAENFSIALYDAAKRTLDFTYFIDERKTRTELQTIGKDLNAYVIRSGQSALLTADEQEQLREQGEIEFHGPAAEIWLGVPLKTEKAVIGVMAVQHYRDAAAYTERDRRVLEFISAQVARTIERKRTEQEIRLLAHAIESTSDAISITDTAGRLIFVNQHFIETYDYTGEDVIGRNLQIVFSASHPAEFYSKMLERSREKSWFGEMMHRSRDGREIPVYMTLSSMRDESGNITGYIGVAREITELKLAEHALRESEERYRILIENVRDAIFRLTPEGIILSLNAAFTAITGWSAAEWIGKSFADIVHPSDLALARDTFRRALRGEIPPSVELRVRKQAGEYVTAEITNIPLFQQDTVVGVLGEGRDITERKRLEEHLRQSQKMESIGILAGGIAHDFNNILTIILAYASSLQQQGLPPEKLAQSVDAIKKTTYRGAELVQQILTFARKTGVSRESVSLNAIIEDLAKMLRETFPKTIAIELRLEKDLPSVVGDANQMHQALLNLCVNARDAMPEGGTISFATTLVPGGRLREEFPDAEVLQYFCVTISDTGAGIPDSHKAHIFEPFFTTKERGRGTGLGLAVVYGIVKSHNGFINFQTTPGKGTTFHMYIPVAPTLAEPVAPDPANLEMIPGGKETLLFVEDEEMLLDLLNTLLAAKGYDILAATDGEEAVEIYRSRWKEIALVLTDVGLPKMSGMEAFQRMRAINPNVKVILASGYLDQQLKSQMIEEGARDFVQKPYEPNEILKKIRQALDTP